MVCLQARLLFWNILEGQLRLPLAGRARYRMYFVEYVVHFEFVLRGMARIGLVPPLGGTSNIFVTDVLREIAISTEDLVEGGIAPRSRSRWSEPGIRGAWRRTPTSPAGWPATATRSR